MEEINIKMEEIEDDEVGESICVKDEICQEDSANYEHKADHEIKVDKLEIFEDINCDLSDFTYPEEDDTQFYSACKKNKSDKQEIEYMDNEETKITYIKDYFEMDAGEGCSYKNLRKCLTIDEAVTMILCPTGYESEEEYLDDDSENDDYVHSLHDKERDISEVVSSEVDKMISSDILVIEGNSAEIIDIEEDNLHLSAYDKRPKWQKCEFDPPNDIQWRDSLEIDESWKDHLPSFYFQQFFDDSLIKFITEQTNLYASQAMDKDLKLCCDDMKKFIGMLMIMGIVKMPSYRCYWANATFYSPIANAMSRNKFEGIKQFLHFNNNNFQKKAGDEGYDKLFKIRPVFESIKNKCRSIPQEEHQSVGEQIIPTKVRQSLKQYSPKKPHKWGYKVISRAGISGIIYDIEFYLGKESTVGVSSGYVLRLAEKIPKHKNYKLFYDNWFSSISLARILKDSGILTLSTIRPNRLAGCTLLEEKELKEKGRGSFDYRVDKTSDSIAIKWYDNRPVHLLSTYAGVNPVDKCKRWDGKNKCYIEIDRPLAIKEYYKFMGGVDLCDMLLELYRIDFKSKKWYMRIFFYLLDLSVVNGWLLYRRNSILALKEKHLSLLEFKMDVAHYLLSTNKATPKRSRPSYDSPPAKRRRHQPSTSIRFDGLNHFPTMLDDQMKCKKCSVKKTKVHCDKCQVALCLTKNRNCFKFYHEK